MIFETTMSILFLYICKLSVTMALNLLLWNVRGIMSSTICLGNLLDQYDCDIAFINEHKLRPQNASFMDSIHSKYATFTCCQETSDPFGPIKCGKSGVSIMFKKQLEQKIVPMENINDRIIGAKLVGLSHKPLYLLCVYMPSENDIKHYREIIEILDDLYEHLSEDGACHYCR